MTLPMSPTSLFDTSRSEYSHTGSLESFNSVEHNSDTSSPDVVFKNDRLKQLRRQARCEAEKRHAARAEKKMHKPSKCGIVKSKRQKSNIRSAEICRDAKGLYAKLLEKNIIQEEEANLAMMKELFDQVAEIVRVKQRIEELEEKECWIEAKASCDKNGDEGMEFFFPGTDIDVETMRWEQKKIEMFMNEEVNVRMTEAGDATSQNQKRFGMKNSLGRSPASLLDIGHQVPGMYM